MTYELDTGTYIAPNRITVKDWLETWLRDYLYGVKPSTVFLYTQDVEKYIIPHLGAIRLEALDTGMIQRFYNELLYPKKSGITPLAPKTVKCIHGVFHKALKKAVEVGNMRNNPTEACELPRVVRPDIKPLEEDQITAFLNAIQGHTHEYLHQLEKYCQR